MVSHFKFRILHTLDCFQNISDYLILNCEPNDQHNINDTKKYILANFVSKTLRPQYYHYITQMHPC